MQHIIKKQIIELVIDKHLDAFAMQQQVSDLYWHQLVVLLEKELDKASPPDNVTCIDRVEIDLGVVTVNNNQSIQLNQALLTAITQQLQQHITGSQRNNTVMARQPQAIHSFRQWLLYMQKGHLPWNMLQVTDQWLNQVLEALAADYNSVSTLRNEIQKNPTVVNRIAQQHTSGWLVQLITVLTAGNQAALPGVLQEMEYVLQQLRAVSGTVSTTTAVLHKQLWQQLLQAASAQQQQSTEQLAAAVLKNNITSRHLPVLQSLLQQAANIPLLQGALVEVQRQLVQKAAGAPANENKELTATEAQPFKSNTQEPENKPVTAIHQTIREEDSLFVQQAGLVLVHPFLRSFFSLCSFMEGNQFANAANRQKAVYLLHYIATGTIVAEEHELVVPKLLCNYPIEEPVEKEVDISQNELQEADDLLRAAIAQWSLLKNTSPDGLRQGFLQRNGKLYTRNDQLYIEIEKNAIDVLLDHLPWNLSMIKLPWVPGIIRVEWR